MRHIQNQKPDVNVGVEGGCRLNLFPCFFAIIIANIVCSGCQKSSFTSDSPQETENEVLDQTFVPISDTDAVDEMAEDQKAEIDELDTLNYWTVTTQPTEKAIIHDHLFVIDTSISMLSNGILEKINEGFSVLANSQFPPGSRAAVLAMLGTDGLASKSPHPSLKDYGLLQYEPGLSELVSSAAIANFVTQAKSQNKTELVSRFQLSGCSPWFEPDATDPSGASCFKSNTQIAGQALNCEPGILAASQWIERNPNLAFRPRSHVHITFVSDTQGSGCGKSVNNSGRGEGPGELFSPEHLSLQKNSSQFIDMIMNTQSEIQSVTFNSISPSKDSPECGENWKKITDGRDYYNEYARATGGTTIDVCAKEESKSWIELLATLARKGRQLGEIVVDVPGDNQITFVEIDGKRHSQFERISSHQVRISDVFADDSLTVRIAYLK